VTQVNLLDIQGVQLLNTTFHRDNRGFLAKILQNSSAGTSFGEIESLLISNNVHLGTIRGMHFQVPPFAEKKFVTCLNGKIFDVVVDLRRTSKTYGCWGAVELSGEALDSIVLPAGTAHGYQTLTEIASVLYAVSSQHTPEKSYSLKFNDETVGISWPLQVTQIAIHDEFGISLEQATNLFNVQ
jgi:dTDP-4-dehydrorhamnose 3,5-epimerase